MADIEKSTKPILDLAESYKQLSDDDLKHKTIEFKERLKKGETLDDIMCVGDRKRSCQKNY